MVGSKQPPPTPAADPAAPSAPDAETERHPYYAWHIRDHRDSYQDCDVVCREAWDAATDAAQRQHTAALAERDALRGAGQGVLEWWDGQQAAWGNLTGGPSTFTPSQPRAIGLLRAALSEPAAADGGSGG